MTPALEQTSGRKSFVAGIDSRLGTSTCGSTPLSQRSRLPGLAVILLGFLVAPGAHHAQALSIYTDNAMGNLSLVSPPSGPDVVTGSPSWNDVPGLSTAIYSRAGDNLEITVTAEIKAPGMVGLRTLVDGIAAVPDDVVFKFGSDIGDGVRSFTFIKNNLAAGRHVVQAQWFADATASIGDRTLSVNSAAPAWGTGRLAVAAAADLVSKTSATWEDIPDLVTTLQTDATRDFKITFSAELADAAAGRFFARALVDGQLASDVLFTSAASQSRSGTRSFTFVKKGVPAGTHTVKIQWYAADAGASLSLAGRTLTAFASPPSTTGGGLVGMALEGPPITLATGSWTDVPLLTSPFTTTEPSANVQIGVSAEMRVSGGRMFLRALIDGQPTLPGDVLFVWTGAEFRAQSFAFIKKNVLAGTHTVKIQAYVDGGATAQLADRTMSVLFKRRHGTDFAQPYSPLTPRYGAFPMLVICFDPLRPGETRPTETQVVNQHRGTDGGVSVEDWYRENTTGEYPFPILFLGCQDNNWFVAPAGRQGNWYWDNSAWPRMWEDAIKAASDYIPFHSFDKNRDGHITGNELTVNILRPQNVPGGFFRSASVAVDGISTPLTFDVLDVYFSANDSNRRLNVGVIAHEAAHAALGAGDMYSGYHTNAGYYSVMSAHFRANHIDPFHKLKSGHLTPDVVEINTWSSRTVTLAAVETLGEAIILYDPRKNDREYFIIENRWGGAAGDPNYDSTLPAQGVAVWHIVEDMSLANQFRPSGAPGFDVASGEWARLGIRFLGVLSSAGAFKELKWADGTHSNIKVVANSSPAEVVQVNVLNTGNAICGNGFVENGEVCDGDLCCAQCTGFMPAGTICRAAVAGGCDVAETCRGASTTTCPADAVAAVGATCRAAVAGSCDAAETCTGLATCPADTLLADGTSCGETCAEGTCTAGACLGIMDMPRDDCRQITVPLKSKLKIIDDVVDTRDQLEWTWNVGEATRLAEFVRPNNALVGSDYALCVYDESVPGVPQAIVRARVAAGVGWKAVPTVAPTSYLFTDLLGRQDGITSIKLKPGLAGRAQIAVKGKGASLDTPLLPLAPPTRVQLQVVDGVCFEATFGASGSLVNTANTFLGRGD